LFIEENQNKIQKEKRHTFTLWKDLESGHTTSSWFCSWLWSVVPLGPNWTISNG